jgi:citrate lyase alpha subunit
MGGGWGWGMRGFSLVDATAEATGLTVDEVIAALQEGQTFAQIAEAQGVDPQAIADAFLADREAALAEAVNEGRLTQEQADQMLEQMAEHVSEHLEQPWTPRSFGGGRMGQGRFGRWSRPGTGFAPRFSPRQ